MTSRKQGGQALRRCGAAALVAMALMVASAAESGEFMFMPTAAIVQSSGAVDDPALDKRQLLADVFYAGDFGRLRFLSELQIDRDGADMERLQAGFRLTPETSIWFGRYHNPIGYWNLEHHHGHYMETSAERPRILEFEDEGGPLPVHLTGALLQGLHSAGLGSLHYELGVATGPRLGEAGLEPVNVLRTWRKNKLALVARLAWRPDATLDNQFGAFVARTNIPFAFADTEIRQDLAGVYLSRDFDRLRLFGEVFLIEHRVLRGADPQWPSYWAGYAQVEYKLVPAVLTAFARHEAISSTLTERYVELFPKVPKQRAIAGLRWDFRDNQALKVEVIRDRLVSGATYNAIELQWSGMFH